MAGVEFKKYAMPQAGEMEVHYDTEIRKNEKVHHSNKNINPALTHLNYFIGARSYQEIVGRMEQAVERADKEHPPKRVKKDRKHWFILEAKCPPELEGTPEEDRFYQKTYELYRNFLPLEGAAVHKDEKEAYYDPKKKEYVIPRNHIDMFGACINPDGRCNCKALISPEMCKKVNDEMQKMCLEEWGISYQTGEGRKGKYKSVEQLKQESQVALQAKLAKEGIEVVKAMRAEKEELREEIRTENDNLETVRMFKDEVATDIESLKADKKSLENDAKNLNKVIEVTEKQAEKNGLRKADEYIAYYRRNRMAYEKDPEVYKGFEDARKATKRVQYAWSKYHSSITSMGRRHWAETAIKLQNYANEVWQDAKNYAEYSKAEAALRRKKAEIKKEIDELLNPHISDFKNFCKIYDSLSVEKQAKYRQEFETVKRKNKGDIKTMGKHLKRLVGEKSAMEYDIIKEVQTDRRNMNKLANRMLAEINNSPKSGGDEKDIFEMLENYDKAQSKKNPYSQDVIASMMRQSVEQSDLDEDYDFER